MPDSGFQYSYDARSRRYRNLSTGQYVTPAQVRGAVDTIIDSETVKIRDISQRLIDGQINLADWQSQVASMLKTLHVAMGVAAVGGWNNANQADFGYMGSLIKKQYQYLSQFAQDIASGKQKLDGTLLQRSGLYTQAARGTFEEVVRNDAQQAGLQSERRVLGASDSCPTCLDQAGQGWQPIGTLNAIGDSECRSNCHCAFQFK